MQENTFFYENSNLPWMENLSSLPQDKSSSLNPENFEPLFTFQTQNHQPPASLRGGGEAIWLFDNLVAW